MMFGIRPYQTVVLILVLFLCGCGASLGVDSGVEPTTTVALDDNFEFSVDAEKGDVLGLDMPQPNQVGYHIEGAAFDPTVFRLDHFLNYDRDGSRRVQYMFTVLENGVSDILIKMRNGTEGRVELFKRVTVNVGGDHGLF